MNAPRRATGGAVAATALTYLDGKPLAVGVASKAPDAARGRVMGGFAKGYKLHAWMTEDRRVPVWCVAPLNAHTAGTEHPQDPVAPALSPAVVRARDAPRATPSHPKIRPDPAHNPRPRLTSR